MMQDDDDDNYPSVKVILIGSSGVGKTTIISSFLESPFEQQAAPTVAPAQCSAKVTIDGKTIILQIWDTAGQEKFQSISKMYYQQAEVAIVCYQSDKFNQEELAKWIGGVREIVPDCKIVIVATKSDLISDEDMLELHNNAVTLVDTFKAASHFVTSAKSGNGIHELFHYAGEIGIQVAKPEVNNIVKPVAKPADKKGKNKNCDC